MSTSASYLTIESTEVSHSPSSTGRAGFKTNNSVTDPIIEIDVKRAVTVDFNKFLVGICAEETLIWGGLDEKIATVVGTVKDLCAKYSGTSSDGTALYRPFCDLANKILECLSIDKEMTFVRNDPKIIHGNYTSDQSPDVVAVRKNVADQNPPLESFAPLRPEAFVYQTEQDELINAPLLSWHDVTMAFEFDSLSKKDPFLSACGRGSKKGKGPKRTLTTRSTSSKPPRSSQISAESTSKKRKADAYLESSTKKQKVIVYEHYKTKLARHAAHQLSAVSHRRHCILALIKDQNIMLGYYDHGGIVHSEEINFVEQLYQFVALIKVLATRSAARLGSVSSIQVAGKEEAAGPDRPPPRLASGASGRSKHEVLKHDGVDGPESPPYSLTLKQAKIVVGGSIFQRPPFAVTGRGCRVRAAYIVHPTGDQPTEKLTLKTGWQLERRTKEWDLLDTAREGLEGKVKDDENLKGLSDSLPKLYLRGILDDILAFTSFRVLANIHENFNEHRELRALLFETFPKHLHKVKEEAVFRKCFREIFQAHYWVYRTARVRHRDISVDNLMARECPGGYKGVLMNWDLAEDQKNDPTMDNTGTRTGTREFMSVELHLGGPHRHKIRYDWESFFYYLLWATFILHADVNEVPAFNQMRNELKGWIVIIDEEVADPDAFRNDKLFNAKIGFLTYMKRERYFEGLKLARFRLRETYITWIDPLYTLFEEGYSKKLRLKLRSDDPRMESLDGSITYEQILVILEREPPLAPLDEILVTPLEDDTIEPPMTPPVEGDTVIPAAEDDANDPQ